MAKKFRNSRVRVTENDKTRKVMHSFTPSLHSFKVSYINIVEIKKMKKAGFFSRGLQSRPG